VVVNVVVHKVTGLEEKEGGGVTVEGVAFGDVAWLWGGGGIVHGVR
jgi:hypothetical protein